MEEQERHLLSQPLPSDRFGDIDGTTFGEYTVVAPKAPIDLLEWGEEMHHCVGSYAKRLIISNDIFLQVMKKEKHFATAQLEDGVLVQFYGKHNSIIDHEVAKRFIEVLTERNLLTLSQSAKAIERWAKESPPLRMNNDNLVQF